MKQAEGELERKRGEIRAVMLNLEHLEGQLDELEKEKADINRRMADLNDRSARAAMLINSLSDEAKRWQRQRAEIESQLPHLLGESVLTAALVSFTGPLSHQKRDAVVAMFRESLFAQGLSVREGFDAMRLLVDDNELEEWVYWGLPNDNGVLCSAVIASNVVRWPIIIDPHGVVPRWLTTKEQKNSMRCLSYALPSFAKSLAFVARAGFPAYVVVAEEEMPEVITYLLRRQT
jgi:hypothetical protein